MARKRTDRATHERRDRLTGMPVRLPLSWRRALRALPALAPLLLAAYALAADHVTLRTGFDLDCDHRVSDGTKTRLYLDPASTNYVEVDTDAILSDELLPEISTAPAPIAAKPAEAHEVLSPAELHEVLQGAGKTHDLDVDLLASVVHAESNSRIHARSHAGAQGLMQLMPATAATLGVHDAFVPADNVGGGAAYLDALLTRYHNNVAFALAAYNAGPGAVDRWHGIPPYRETRAYVARIIHEFNSRYAARESAALAIGIPAHTFPHAQP